MVVYVNVNLVGTRACPSCGWRARAWFVARGGWRAWVRVRDLAGERGHMKVVFAGILLVAIFTDEHPWTRALVVVSLWKWRTFVLVRPYKRFSAFLELGLISRNQARKRFRLVRVHQNNLFYLLFGKKMGSPNAHEMITCINFQLKMNQQFFDLVRKMLSISGSTAHAQPYK